MRVEVVYPRECSAPGNMHEKGVEAALTALRVMITLILVVVVVVVIIIVNKIIIRIIILHIMIILIIKTHDNCYNCPTRKRIAFGPVRFVIEEGQITPNPHNY